MFSLDYGKLIYTGFYVEFMFIVVTAQFSTEHDNMSPYYGLDTADSSAVTSL